MKNSNPVAVVRVDKSRFYFSGIVAGIAAAVGISIFAYALGEIEMDAALIMFFKYIVLIPILVFVLVNHRKMLGESYKFVDGIRQGGLVTITAAIAMALIGIFLYTPETSLEMGNPTEPHNYLGSAFVAGGVRLMECLVFGMIITFICLQFLKRGRPGEQNLAGNSAK